MTELKQRLQSEQTEQHFLKGEASELRNEVMMTKSQLSMATNIQEQLRAQVFELKDKVAEVEHREFLASSSKEMMQREIQQLRNQLQQANQFIQSQQQVMLMGGAKKSSWAEGDERRTAFDRAYEEPPRRSFEAEQVPQSRMARPNYDEQPPPRVPRTNNDE